MSKRVPLSARREQDKKGVNAFFEPPAPAEGSNQEAPAPAPPTVQAELVKMTMYVRPDQVVALESIQLAERKRTGKKPDKSALTQEAFDLLIAKYQLEP